MEESLSIFMFSLHRASLIQNSIVHLYCHEYKVRNSVMSSSTHLLHS